MKGNSDRLHVSWMTWETVCAKCVNVSFRLGSIRKTGKIGTNRLQPAVEQVPPLVCWYEPIFESRPNWWAVRVFVKKRKRKRERETERKKEKHVQPSTGGSIFEQSGLNLRFKVKQKKTANTKSCACNRTPFFQVDWCMEKTKKKRWYKQW